MCNNKADLTILSKHCDRSDELYTWCVHWYEDHTVLAMPEKQVHKQKGHHTWAAAPILLRCFFNQLLLLGMWVFLHYILSVKVRFVHKIKESVHISGVAPPL